MEEWEYGWIDEWIDGWMVRGTDRQIDELYEWKLRPEQVPTFIGLHSVANELRR